MNFNCYVPVEGATWADGSVVMTAHVCLDCMAARVSDLHVALDIGKKRIETGVWKEEKD
jgi:hypothetical protein